jgi:hypothetical protein
MTDPKDAGELYLRAIDHYRDNRDLYHRAATSKGSDSMDLAGLAAVDLLLEGAKCRAMTLLAANPQRYVDYRSYRQPLQALDDLGGLLIRLGLLELRENHLQRAGQYFQAAFSLGAKLYEERLVYEEFLAGMALMGSSALALADLSERQGDNAAAAQLHEFDSERLRFNKHRIEPVWRIISSIDPKVIASHAGDVSAFASPATAERMWRVEAVLKLGRQRFHAGRAADQQQAVKELQRYTQDPDPAVRAAAKAALALTIEEYRRLGT